MLRSKLRSQLACCKLHNGGEDSRDSFVRPGKIGGDEKLQVDDNLLHFSSIGKVNTLPFAFIFDFISVALEITCLNSGHITF